MIIKRYFIIGLIVMLLGVVWLFLFFWRDAGDIGDFDGVTGAAILDSSTVSVVPTRTICTAPCGVFFDATATTSSTVDDPFWQLDYTWDFGDSGAVFINRPGVDANKGKGAIAAHVFANPGSYNVKLVVRDKNGNSGSKSVSITVQNPDSVYSGSKTKCVSLSGDFNGCPSGASRLNSIPSRLNQNERVLFHKGETFDTNEIIVESGGYVGAYGSANGPNPVMRWKKVGNPGEWAKLDGIFFILNTGSILTGLRIESDYNAATGSGFKPLGARVHTSQDDVTIYRNNFFHLGQAFILGGDDRNTGLIGADNKITAWQIKGIGGDAHRSALLGNLVHQALDSEKEHLGNFRNGKTEKFLISHNDFFNNDGPDTGHQPTIRFGSSGVADLSIVSDNRLEGGAVVANHRATSAGAKSIRGKAIWERNTFIAGHDTIGLFGFGYGGTIVRNNLFIKPDGARFEEARCGTEYIIQMLMGSKETEPQNWNIDNYVYDNTAIFLDPSLDSSITFLDNRWTSQSKRLKMWNNVLYAPYLTDNVPSGLPCLEGSNGAFIKWKTSIDNLVSDNNLFYAPNNGLGGKQFAYLDDVRTSLSDWRGMGFDGNSITSDPRLVDVDGGNYRLSSGSGAIDSGLGFGEFKYQYDDIQGNARPQGNGYDIGAYEFGSGGSPSPPLSSSTVRCGNGIRESGEGCDDGNTVNGDGCTAICGEESGWNCSGEPSQCQEDLPIMNTDFKSKPEYYEIGSGVDFEVEVFESGVKDVLFQTWSDNVGLDGDNVAVFVDDSAPYIYPSSKLDEVPVGAGIVQALLRSSSGVEKLIKFQAEFVSAIGCVLGNASWDATSAVEGEVVSITVSGVGCGGLGIGFEVLERDLPPVNPDDPVITNPMNVAFTNGKAVSTWISEYQDDNVGGPEYYFNAFLIRDSSVFVTSSNELVVSKRVAEGALVIPSSSGGGGSSKLSVDNISNESADRELGGEYYNLFDDENEEENFSEESLENKEARPRIVLKSLISALVVMVLTIVWVVYYFLRRENR